MSKVGYKKPPESGKMKKGETRNPNGRPRKIHSIIKKEGLKASQINDIILEILAMNKEEIDALIKNPKAKSFEVLIASAIKKGVSKGDLTQIFSQALVRALGSPKQHVEHSGEIKTTTINIKPKEE